MDSVFDGMFVRARASLGVTSFGMQVESLPPNHEHYPEHDETSSGQEEVYIPIAGSARLIVGGSEYELVPGVFARVGPAEKRKILPGPDGVKLIAIGGVPGKRYEAPDWSEVGGSIPGPSE
ncbi:MAG: hypothetical protein OEQ13_04215 [Acidobacteriota bacterium]|nr:hypothetical protein [Acidobacteriota bacterium]